MLRYDSESALLAEGDGGDVVNGVWLISRASQPSAHHGMVAAHTTSAASCHGVKQRAARQVCHRRFTEA